ncbi:MAG: hypothetical protein GVY16_11265 [Planctomycetes bacterium]|jgi:tetratricopeptide (TPR) repeat protein|nr:hypothetical protein [Planctomycetota bacterium]
MPTLRAVRGDILAAFEKLYGPDIKRVKASDDPADDLALAWRMVEAARVTKLDPALIGAMCDAAYELTVDVDGGETTAFAALGVLGRKVPQRQFEAAVKHAGLCERVYTDEPTPANGEFLIRSRMTVAELGTAEREFAEALAAWRGAIDVAEEANSTTLVALKARLSAFADRAQSAKKVAALAVQLDQAPHDAAVRSEMLTLHLRELDNPAEAAKYLDAAVDEATKTNCLLAAEPVENLAEEAALNLAEWYGRMINEAGVGGRRLMADRAKAYYGRFFELHEGEDDALAMRAALGVQKIGGRMPPAEDAEADDGRQRSPAVTVDLEKGEQITNLTLAEFVAAHPDLTRVTRREIGTARKLTDLRPLRKLDKLTRLELHDARQIKDLSVLAQMPNLTVLTITGLEVKDVWALEGLSKLQHLNLSGGANITDLTPLARLHRLKSLHLSGCKQVTDLKPLKGLGDLERLNLSHCRGVNDIGPLAKLARHLTWLSLHNTKLSDIMPLARMGKLKYLDLRKCEKLPYDDAVWLKKRLSECKVHFDVTAPPKAKDSDNR